MILVGRQAAGPAAEQMGIYDSERLVGASADQTVADHHTTPGGPR